MAGVAGDRTLWNPHHICGLLLVPMSVHERWCTSQEFYYLLLLCGLQHFSWAWSDLVMFYSSWPWEMAGHAIIQYIPCNLDFCHSTLSSHSNTTAHWQMLCVNFPERLEQMPIYPPQIGNQSMDTTRFIGDAYRSRNDSKIAVSPKPTPAPGTYCTACKYINEMESVLSRWLSWSESFPSSLAGVFKSI